MWTDLQKALVVTRREIKDQFRDWRIIAPIIILTVFFPGLMNFTAQQAVDFVAKYGAPIIADRLIPFLLMVVGFFPISVSLVIALESFVGEKERRSIEPLLSSPLTDVQLYLGKLMEVAPSRSLYSSPMHPYTKALLSAVPVPNPAVKSGRTVLKGDVPSPANPPPGCPFHPRCPEALPDCSKGFPEGRVVGEGHLAWCIRV